MFQMDKFHYGYYIRKAKSSDPADGTEAPPKFCLMKETIFMFRLLLSWIIEKTV